jgi:diguanylate cyclase (GGDEF)-like protein
MRYGIKLQYLLLLLPTLTEWLEVGHLPQSLHEWLTEIVLTLLIAMLLWQMNRLIHDAIRRGETDGLTGLANRQKFNQELPKEIMRARRLRHSLVLAYFDLDRFKAINDYHGHPAGDHVLRFVARQFIAFGRDKIDTVFRIGGDEFIMLFPVANAEGVKGIKQRLMDFQIKINSLLSPYNSGVSLGLAELTKEDTLASLMERADTLMYQQKAEHRNLLDLSQLLMTEEAVSAAVPKGAAASRTS